jgi:hypothetical protein
VQREIIRKIGAEKMLKACNAETIDTFIDQHTGQGNEYRLMKMNIGSQINRRYLVFNHASVPGIVYAKPVPPECTKALHARAWILSMVERDSLSNINVAQEAEIIANLPQVVS